MDDYPKTGFRTEIETIDYTSSETLRLTKRSSYRSQENQYITWRIELKPRGWDDRDSFVSRTKLNELFGRHYHREMNNGFVWDFEDKKSAREYFLMAAMTSR